MKNKEHALSKEIYSKKKPIAEDFFSENKFRVAVAGFNLSELLEGIYAKLNPLFAVDCIAIVLYDARLSHIVDSHVCGMISGSIPCSSSVVGPVDFSEITKEISRLDFPILRSREEWEEVFGQNHRIGNHDAEYQFHGYIPIETNGRIYGTFELHNLERQLSTEGLTFCCNVAEFIAGLFSVTEKKGKETSWQPVLHPHSGGDCHQEKVQQLEAEIERLKSSLEEFHLFEVEKIPGLNTHEEIIGHSEQMRSVFSLLSKISPTDSTVLILGETGTGKELIARAIHHASGRASEKLIKVNCAAIPPNLIESELFGHEKGAFTGATEKRVGKFELADKGTIFLDEIGELPLELQVKLLRVLQEKEVEPIGGKKTIRTDVRVISATNRNLLSEVEAGRFRQDLFYRLNVFPLTVPSLRERRTDIPLLATHFLKKFAAKSNRVLEGFSKRAITMLVNYSWPGNVRELEHLIERHVVMSQGRLINRIEIPDQSNFSNQDHNGPVKTIFENERDHIFAVLELCNGRISGKNGAAKLLGVPATTLNSKIKRLGLAKKHTI
ncbi:sigma-54 interaction domain-containing protein [Pedobacter zeae]|uniref:Transcriptional regulator with GAF, ATPase, and Fis domain n=1 Tax=Pedobacter zeae TaxID=1737356 RepID=A0A7W6KAF6_9SPHI|nr:sigma-54 dependent transcriptional regulator [Pedobacter zeae]MBB4108168.1 transcriptional regulator with GAF, ATPase, and Fis domain [Pedobacter zeae]GGG94574.1 hypothetical protein GCM10007422_04990 [Pedobacter zeae]